MCAVNCPPHNSINKQRGNVLFLILIAVALFAALSYAVTSSTRSGSGDISKEDTALAIAQMNQFVTSVMGAIQRLQASGCSAEQISFETTSLTGYINPNAPSNRSCHVFDPAGGGIVYVAPNLNWLDQSKISSVSYGKYVFTGANGFRGVGTGGASGTDLAMILPWVNKTICDGIDRLIDGNNFVRYNYSPGNTPSVARWTGTYTYGGIFSYNNGGQEAWPPSYTSYCFEEDNEGSLANGYHFTNVLIIR